MEGEATMPWKEMEVMSLRKEFVVLAKQAGSNIRELCRHYGISSRTGYKWLKRYAQEGESGLEDRSKRPKHTHRRTDEEMESKVLEVREQTGWGGRKIARVLQGQGHTNVPHPNTITDILRRAGKLDEEECAKHQPVQRFERSQANELWQMDFKGHFPMVNGRCHPLTVLDDHSRFCLGLKACANETGGTVKGHLQAIFRQYGLPQAILCDNGGPWGAGYPDLELSALAVWLIRLGVHPQHGRPSHPQTQGKEERFHRTLKAELLQGRSFVDLEDCQQRFDIWRDRYNLVRPHEALQLDTPIQHFQLSQHPFPETIPSLEYGLDALVRKVQSRGRVTYHDREFNVGKGLLGEYVELRPTNKDGIFDVYYCTYKVRQIDIASGIP
jgi:transposase InsO family protein